MSHGKKVLNYLDSIGISTWGKGKWPGNSPDANVIEQVWAWMKERIDVEPFPTTIKELEDRAKQVWNSIPNSLLENLVDSFPERIEKIIEADGGTTKY